MLLHKRIEEFNKQIQPKHWKAVVNLDNNSPILEKGLRYLESDADLVLAVCLNNGYYNRENVYRMLRFALAFSKRVQIFTTDGPAKHNYRALGKEDIDTVRVTRLAKNRLQNQCLDGLKRVNSESQEKREITFIEWKNIYEDRAYKASYRKLKELFTRNTKFRNDVKESSRCVLTNRIGITEDVQAMLSTGVEYVLEEIAFILAYQELDARTKPIADHGSRGFNYIYHEPWPVFEKIVDGTYGNEPVNHIGFVIVKID